MRRRFTRMLSDLPSRDLGALFPGDLMRTIVLDTNVLLSDPEVFFAYPDADIVIPETVLMELDKLKTARVDPELRFKGREVSRILFELSEQGNLIAGVQIPDGGMLRVVTFDADTEMPEGLSPRNSDDRILAVAAKACGQGCEGVTLITNDLNMLLKAQTLGIRVERRQDESEASFSKRFIIRPFQRYKVPLGILMMSLAVFVAILIVAVMTTQRQTSSAALPEEFQTVLTADQKTILGLVQDLQRNPNDYDTETKLAKEYYTLRLNTGVGTYGDLARTHFTNVLEARPRNTEARTILGQLYWLTGDADRALRETNTVLQQDPNNVSANFNLGIYLWESRKEYQGAVAQFDKVIELTKTASDPETVKVNTTARQYLAQVIDEATKAGKTVKRTGGSS